MEYIYSLVSKPEILIVLDEVDGRKQYTFKGKKGEPIKLPTFMDRENITGKVIIDTSKSKKFEHTGIKIEIIGSIEHHTDKKSSTKFIALTRDLEAPGVLTNDKTQIPFKFTNVEKQYETYMGNNMEVR